MVDLFSDRIAFERDIQFGDTFTVVYTARRTMDGEELSPGPVKAASIFNRGKMIAVIRHTGADGKTAYFNEEGKPIGNNFLRFPLQFTRISSVFSKSRFHPILRVRRPHNGVDFAAPLGTPVRSVADGTVVIASVRGGAGRMVEIRHNDRYSTAYLHLSRIAGGVSPGMRVRRGQVIGAVGMTGYATAPHLHFSFYDRGVYVDPLKIHLPTMQASTTPIPVAVLTATLQMLRDQRATIMLASSGSAEPEV
jgi:murein DD-endopeptidase MepM/ murein hydrolase activator NlpD